MYFFVPDLYKNLDGSKSWFQPSHAASSDTKAYICNFLPKNDTRGADEELKKVRTNI
jgi:hypothetical protein